MGRRSISLVAAAGILALLAYALVPWCALRGCGWRGDGAGRLVVLVVAHNEAALLPGFLDRLAPLPNLQVVLVDQSSTDATAEIARSRGAAVVTTPVFGSSEPAIPLGMAAAELFDPTWVLLLDPDEWLHAEFFARLADVAWRCWLAEFADVGLVDTGTKSAAGVRVESWSKPRLFKPRSLALCSWVDCSLLVLPCARVKTLRPSGDPEVDWIVNDHRTLDQSHRTADAERYHYLRENVSCEKIPMKYRRSSKSCVSAKRLAEFEELQRAIAEKDCEQASQRAARWMRREVQNALLG
jgi:glycosyltransferase involved in cell wall biosynthesis